MKSLLCMKCRNFISGLHILVSNKIPESILNVDVLSNILRGISQYLLTENMYTLLYGSAMNLYYNMRIVWNFIINNVLYMTICLPLKHRKATIMSLYGLYSYYIPTNMSDYNKTSSPYTKIDNSHPYLLLSDDQFALLDDNMYKNTILLFGRTNKNCYINIIEHAEAKVITFTCTFSYYHNITVHASLVATNDFFFLLNMLDELNVICGLYNRETICSTYSVGIINRKDLCDCVIQTTVIQLIGSHTNCSSNGNFLIQHTLNFVTE